jgi:hypothetical protein
LSLKLDPQNPLATPVQTRDGKPARLLCVDFKCGNLGVPIVAALFFPDDGFESLRSYRADGTGCNKTGYGPEYDLVNAPVRKSVFRNMYNTGPGVSHSSLGEANRVASGSAAAKCRSAILEIIEEDGIPIEAKIHKVEK